MVNAFLYDIFMAPLGWMGLRRLRRKLVENLPGRVLEVGCGTGLLLRDAPNVDVSIDTDFDALLRARVRAGGGALVCADVQALPFKHDVFDAAVASLTFCSVRSPSRGLAGVRRVLKAGAPFRLLEHVRAPGRALGAVLDALAPHWVRLSGGCHLNRSPRVLLPLAGFKLVRCHASLRGTLEHITAVATPPCADLAIRALRRLVGRPGLRSESSHLPSLLA